MMVRRLAVSGWLGLAMIAFAGDAPSRVEIELRPRAIASISAVALGDIASLSGGPDALRERLSRLDISDAPTGIVTVKRSQVEYRLKLADVPAGLFRVHGASEVTIEASKPMTGGERIAEAAREALIRRLPWAADDVSIRLLQPVSATLPAGDSESIRVAAEPHNPSVYAGRVQMDVTVSERGQHKLSAPVYFEVKPLQQVAVCKSAIAKGAVMQAEAVTIEKRPVDPSQTTIAPGDQVVGAVAKRALKPGDTVMVADVDDAAASAVIRLKQPVNIVVHLGSMKVAAGGEALQDGRVGQLIRVQNTASKKIVVGRVTGPGVVELESGGSP